MNSELDQYLRGVVTNSHECATCNHCQIYHGDECNCYLSYECIYNDRMYYEEANPNEKRNP